MSGAVPMFGYHGKYLHFDATTETAHSYPLAADLLRQVIGGSGLGTYLLLRAGMPEIEPLAERSVIVFAFSPLVGSPLTTSAKFAVVTKSPLTSRINDSLASSGFALAGKRTGYDALMITGCAPRPSILVIDEGECRLESAEEAWGLTCAATEKSLRDRLGPEYQFAVIGPAGERQVRFATISHDGRHAGRGGSGAVLGAKQIKAIAVRGHRRCAWADPEGLHRLARDLAERSFGPATAKYRELGTAANLLVFNRLQVLPTRNFQAASFPEAEKIAPEQLAQSRSKTQASCAACTIGCEHIYGLRRDDDAEQSNRSSAAVRMEFENLYALGPLCGVSDPDAVLQASHLCDELGMDTISAGGTIAFAMECVERGWLAAPWLRFGDGESLIRAIDLIGAGKGLGARLALGSRQLAQQLGPEALRLAPQVKGLEIPGYEPRGLHHMALGFAVGTRGADHNRSGAYELDFSADADRFRPTRESIRQMIATEDRAALMDSLILCKFLRGALPDFYPEAAEMLQMVTGWEVTADELQAVARRIVALRKSFNIRAGWTPAEDTLPDRLLDDTPHDRPSQRLSRSWLKGLVADYNQLRGWTPEGWLPDTFSP